MVCVCVCVCLSRSFGDLLSFTLTAFVELMDHGIVSWDTFSVAFIKKVSLLLLLPTLRTAKENNGVIIWFNTDELNS